MQDAQSIFGGPLQPDPAIALRPPAQLPRPKAGPLHKIQYVLEFVGPRSALASTVAALASPQWFSALGEPQIFVMAPSDSEWRPLMGHTAQSFDSIALAWDLISPRGELTGPAAEHLQRVAEQFAPSLSRRVMTMPLPAEVDRTRRQLLQIRENMDVGYGMGVLARSSITEKDVWVTAARLGLDLGATGEFEWRVAGWDRPLLSVSPLGSADRFSLGAVTAGLAHPALSLGFNVPTSPAPMDALEACFRAADAFAAVCQGTVTDENDRPLSDKGKASYRQNLLQAIKALESVGFAPGSSEALRLFGV